MDWFLYDNDLRHESVKLGRGGGGGLAAAARQA